MTDKDRSLLKRAFQIMIDECDGTCRDCDVHTECKIIDGSPFAWNQEDVNDL